MTPPARSPSPRPDPSLRRPQTIPPFPQTEEKETLRKLEAEYDRLIRQIQPIEDHLIYHEKYKNKLTNLSPHEDQLKCLKEAKNTIFAKIVELRKTHFPDQSCNPLRVSTPDKMPPVTVPAIRN